jgi:hypothetical protein
MKKARRAGRKACSDTHFLLTALLPAGERELYPAKTTRNINEWLARQIWNHTQANIDHHKNQKMVETTVNASGGFVEI